MDRPYAIAATPPRKLWGLGRVDVVLATKCLASFFSECATLAASTYALSLAARVPGANRARTYGVLLSLFDAGGACGAALSAALARHVVYGVWLGHARRCRIFSCVVRYKGRGSH